MSQTNIPSSKSLAMSMCPILWLVLGCKRRKNRTQRVPVASVLQNVMNSIITALWDGMCHLERLLGGAGPVLVHSIGIVGKS